MKKQIQISLALCSVMMLVGCNGKMGQFKSDYFTTNPNPLEVVGEKVPATVTANIPAKFFKKNAQVTVTPVLVYADTEQAAQPVTYQGEKVRGNNPVVSYADGGVVTIPVDYNYVPDMLKSELFLNFNVVQGSKQYVLPRVKVADGVIATAALADASTVNPAAAADKFQRIINEKYSADIRFLINQANVRKGELQSKGVQNFYADLRNAAADTSRVIEEINISSYASPEGSYEFNNKLAQNREKNTQASLTQQLKKDKITEFGELTSQFTAEDWEGFQKLVANSKIQDKDLILSVLSMYKDPQEREREIRNLSAVFETLADEILPQLRYSRLTASVNIIGKSDAEINNYVDNDPTKLSIDELLYVATLTDDNARKMKIYKAATDLYPNDYRGFNNLGLTQFVAKDYAMAKSNFDKAARLAPNAGEVQMNEGLLALLNSDYATAQKNFGNAGGVPELNEAIGVYNLKTGDNVAAAKALAGSKTNNAALAQILTKDYSAAKSTLAAVANPDATTYYLTAVVGARTNNADMVKQNLAKAVKLDKSLAAKAANDLEFANFNLSNIF